MGKVENIYKILDEANVDRKVGVRVAKIIDGETFNLYVLEIPPKKRVGAHYHTSGNETYQIIQGNGSMLIGVIENETVKWNEPKNMNEGDCLNVNANEVHQLINLSDIPLICIVGCSNSHTTNDRIMIKGYEKEII